MTKDWTGIEGRFNASVDRLARSHMPLDYALLDQAKRNCPGSLKEQTDEYDRLLAAKLSQRPRGFWSRIFG